MLRSGGEKGLRLSGTWFFMDVFHCVVYHISYFIHLPMDFYVLCLSWLLWTGLL